MKAVYVYDDKLVLTFNYNEASTTVTLDEVNGSIIECSGAPNRVNPNFLMVEDEFGFVVLEYSCAGKPPKRSRNTHNGRHISLFRFIAIHMVSNRWL